MLETLEYPTILWYYIHIDYVYIMPSKKSIGADNQQERLRIVDWIVGFTDGEGCFSVSIIKNSTTKSGWQIFPEFVITQGAKSESVLKDIQKFFKCGKIYVNQRHDNHKENLCRYCVRSIHEISEIIIPFFKENPLMTAKRYDFAKFVKVISWIVQGKHLKRRGMIKIAKVIQQMNRKVPARFLESSETKRQLPTQSGKI